QAAGTYNGLFYFPSNVTVGTAGSGAMTVSKTGSFSGKLLIQGLSSPFSGSFDVTGQGHINARSKQSEVKANLKKAYTSERTFPQPTNPYNTDFGTIEFASDLNLPDVDIVFRKKVAIWPPDSSYSSNYTMLLPGIPGHSDSPAGDGFATIKISSTGVATATGKYADGTALQMSAPIANDLSWPFCQGIYLMKPTNAGIAIGPISFSNNLPAGVLTWQHGFVPTVPYPAGFTTAVSIVSSPFASPPLGQKVIDVSNPTLVLGHGGLSAPIALNNVTYGGIPPKFTFSGANPQNVKLMLSPTGLLTGSFIDPAAPPALVQIFGTVLQNSNSAGGFFCAKRTNGLSGTVSLLK
ncbi:MAG: hypothetical protein JWO95_2480, partial [Verrucomicrobiales bacterium]|nr:hypothetical protein [Verrucomicrobiales bacterium]